MVIFIQENQLNLHQRRSHFTFVPNIRYVLGRREYLKYLPSLFNPFLRQLLQDAYCSRNSHRPIISSEMNGSTRDEIDDTIDVIGPDTFVVSVLVPFSLLERKIFLLDSFMSEFLIL